MKKGIEVYPEYDESNCWRLVIEKKKGKLTLDDIRNAAREYAPDFYLLPVDCFHDEYEEDQFFPPPTGDKVVLYNADLLHKKGDETDEKL